MVLWLRSKVLPSEFRPDSGFQRIPEQINLALEWFNSGVCSAEPEVIRGNMRIPKNEASQEPEKKRNAQPSPAGGGIYPKRREIPIELETVVSSHIRLPPRLPTNKKKEPPLDCTFMTFLCPSTFDNQPFWKGQPPKYTNKEIDAFNNNFREQLHFKFLATRMSQKQLESATTTQASRLRDDDLDVLP